jgi:hypothetical protein
MFRVRVFGREGGQIAGFVGQFEDIEDGGFDRLQATIDRVRWGTFRTTRESVPGHGPVGADGPGYRFGIWSV